MELEALREEVLTLQDTNNALTQQVTDLTASLETANTQIADLQEYNAKLFSRITADPEPEAEADPEPEKQSITEFAQNLNM